MPQREQLFIERQALAMRRVFCGRPIENRLSKGVHCIRIADELALLRIGEFGKLCKLPAPAGGYRFGQRVVEIAEEQEGLRRPPFLAHEQQRHPWRKNEDGSHPLDGVRLGACSKPLPTRPTPHSTV